MKILFAALLIFSNTLIFAQKENLDSLYRQILLLHRERTPSKYPETESNGLADIKCGFGLIAQVKQHLNEFTPDQQYSINKILQRPVLSSSIVSPSGFFRIHYNETGLQKPGYIPALSAQKNAELVAEAFDSSYSFEVNHMGFPPPPADDTSGGDDLFDVYLRDLGDYGYTTPENNSGAIGLTSYIEMDNDFATNESFYTHGIQAAEVTAAHEFHHAIQMGNYGLRSEDIFFYELTSTSMEEFVYDSVNDYYNYLIYYFRSPQLSFSFDPGSNDNREYGLGIWNIFLHEKYGNEAFNIIKRQWELIPDNRAIKAISISLGERQSSMKNELNQFGLWCYFTNYRAKPDTLFSEGTNYPLIKVIKQTDFTPPEDKITINTLPLSNNYYRYLADNGLFKDTIVTVITNTDILNGVDNLNQQLSADFSLFNYQAEGSRKIANNYYSKLTGNDDLLAEANVFNNNIANGGNFETKETHFAFPNPFNYTKNFNIYIPVAYNITGDAKLYVFTPSMELVYTGFRRIITSQNYFVITWDGFDSDNKKLPSGVYLFITDSDDKIVKSKIVIFNE